MFLPGVNRARMYSEECIPMDAEKKPVVLRWNYPGDPDANEVSFEAVLDSACERLKEKHVQFSIRRIREMDEELACIEKELDVFLAATC